jgi:hypothetical protein
MPNDAVGAGRIVILTTAAATWERRTWNTLKGAEATTTTMARSHRRRYNDNNTMTIATIAIVATVVANADAKNATINKRQPRGDEQAQEAPRVRRLSSDDVVKKTRALRDERRRDERRRDGKVGRDNREWRLCDEAHANNDQQRR